MYGIFTYIWLIFMGNVGKYTIHGSSGEGNIGPCFWVVSLRSQYLGTQSAEFLPNLHLDQPELLPNLHDQECLQVIAYWGMSLRRQSKYIYGMVLRVHSAEALWHCLETPWRNVPMTWNAKYTMVNHHCSPPFEEIFFVFIQPPQANLSWGKPY